MRTFLAGIGISQCISEEKYSHLPLAFISPGIYCGYQLNERVPLIPILTYYTLNAQKWSERQT